MRPVIVALALLAAAIFFTGCTAGSAGGQDAAAGSLRAHFEYHESWGFTYGCYGRVTGYVYNAGSAPADNARLVFNLIDTGTGTIRDSKPVFFGTLDAGQSRTYEVILDGECTHDYRVEAVFG